MGFALMSDLALVSARPLSVFVRMWLLIVVVPLLSFHASAGDNSVRLAKEELAVHLKAAVGTATPNGWSFRFGRPEGAPVPKPFESYYRIDGKTVWFWGDDSGSGRKERWGTLFAVELFAEKELGLVWMWPGDDGTFCPRRDALDLKGPRTERFCQPLEKSEFRNYAKAGKFRDWEGFAPQSLRTVTEESCAKGYADRDIWLKRHRLQDRLKTGYGHAFTKWRTRFLKTHPEYLNLHADTGERGWIGTSPESFVKLCFSNEAVVDQIIEDWKSCGTNRYLNVCDNDGSVYCECARCLAKDVDLSGEKTNRDRLADRYVDFWNRIAKKAVAIRPDVVLITYAYSNYRMAPRKTRIAYPDNMLFGFVPSIMDDYCEAELVRWREMGMRHFFVRPNFHCFWGTIPRGLERYLYDNFQMCLKLGMIGVDYDSNLGRYPMHLESYVTARMIADPSLPFEQICADFYSGYGVAANDVRCYFEAVREDGERARAMFIAERASGTHVLDDSQLSCLQAYGRSESRLSEQFAFLRRACATHKGRLSDAEDRRLQMLAAAAGHALATYRFHMAQNGDMQTFEARGRELIRFREKHLDLLPDDYGSIFGRWEGELRTWNKTNFWRAEIDGGEIDPQGLPYGWRCSFERPGYPLNWRPRDCVVGFTNECASAGKWSLKLWTTNTSQLAIWQCYTPIIPGARYVWSADWKADQGVRHVSMRVVARENNATGEKKYDPVSERFCNLPSDGFKTCSVAFTAPTNRGDTVLFYTAVGPGGAGKYVWLDNLKLELIDSGR